MGGPEGSDPGVPELVRNFQRRKASEGEQRLIDALLSGEPVADDPVLEAIRQKLRARVDQKLVAALNGGPAAPGEEVMTRLRRKNQARDRGVK